MAVAGIPKAVPATAVKQPLPSEEETEAQKIADTLALLRAKGKKIAWNTTAINFIRQDIADIRQLFSETVNTASDKIDQVYTAVNVLSDTQTKDKPDDYDELLQKVSDIKSVQEDQVNEVNLLTEHDITPAVWKRVKDDIFNLTEQADSFCLDNKTVSQVDLGTVTGENIGALLSEKVRGTFGAVSGKLQDENYPVSGWWFKTGDSGSGMLFCPATGNVFSLFKSASSDLVDIRIIFGPDLGDIADLSTAEQNFVNLLKTTGLTTELWNKVTADVAALQEVNIAVNSFVSAGLNAYLWKKMLTSVSDINCNIAYPELSVKSWNKVMTALWYEDTDELFEREKQRIQNLISAEISGTKVNNIQKAIVDCKTTLENSILISDLVTNFNKIKEDIASLTEKFSVINAAREADFTWNTWRLIMKRGGLL